MIKRYSIIFVVGSLILCPLSLSAKLTLLTKKLKNNDTVRVVKLDAKDKAIFAEAKEVFLRSFADAYKVYSPEQLFLTDKPDYLTSFLQAAFEDEENDFNNQKEDALFVVAFDSKNHVVGFVAFDKHSKNGETKVYIRQLAIDPAYQNKGLGRLLCIDTLQEIIEHKPAKIVVCTRKINEPAIQFYHKLSFNDATMDEVHPELPAHKYRGFMLTMN
ncbi:hypothetical protein Noda2021_03550 [Candidatus Dependentiae bacterium Noda2021]|nr:hypothetical protein Noda2021_03550 [Candidatus Dependentiae bacterium Noda2021]